MIDNYMTLDPEDGISVERMKIRVEEIMEKLSLLTDALEAAEALNANIGKHGFMRCRIEGFMGYLSGEILDIETERMVLDSDRFLKELRE